MIQLSIPNASDNLYCEIENYLLGPFGLNSSNQTETISVRSSLDSLDQGKAAYNENNVAHVKYSGKLRLFPGHKDMKPSPVPGLPDKLTFTGLNRRLKNDYYQVQPIHGLAITGRATVGSGNYKFFVNRAIVSASPLHVEFIEITAQIGDMWYSPHVRRALYFIPAVSDNYVRTTKSEIMSLYHAPLKNSDWSEKRSYADIVASASELLARVMPAQTPHFDMEKIEVKNPPVFIPSKVFASIDSLVPRILAGSNSTLVPKHFGDLAAKASEGVNRSNVNMIAFLKDLRRPQDLIPKLKNLTSLKTHSGNYLAVNYGILPTISDLQGIAGALKKVLPYVDRHGFSTYNAVHHDQVSSGVFSYELEQRIKIAIDDEDSQFVDILNKIESSGFAPTFENIWDLIPYSFILDWFIDIGGFLERVDTTLRIERMNVRYVTMSQKQTTSTFLNLSETNPMAGTVSVVNYQRWTERHCPLPPLSLSSENKLPNHWLEASALIIQRAK